MISFLITVCDEHFELQRLLHQLSYIVKDTDEIVIVYDSTKVTKEVKNEIAKSKAQSYSYEFLGDFSEYKNFANTKCTKDWILQLDADEFLSDSLAYNIHSFLKDAEDIEFIAIPRVNIVKRIAEKHILDWGWSLGKDETYFDVDELDINSEEYKLLKNYKFIVSEQDTISEDVKSIRHYSPIINYPDYQGRLYRNTSNIKWEGKVHEKIVGYKNFGKIPFDNGFDILHFKDIARQEKQNSYYGILESNRK